MDARVDDFAGVDDLAFTGWHRLGSILFAQGTTEGAAPFADQLDADVATLQQQLSTIDISARGAGGRVEADRGGQPRQDHR